MKHRERVMMALNHEEADRCPMYIGFTPEFEARLRKHMKMEKPSQSHHNPHGGGNTYDLEIALGEDVLMTSVCWCDTYYQDGETYSTEWGVDFKRLEYETKFGNGSYTDIASHPLEKDDAIDSYKAPDPTRPHLYKEAARLIDTYKDEYWIIGVNVCTMFECAWALRGFESLLMDFAQNPDLANRILDIPYYYHLTAAKKLVEMGVDMIWIGDDVGAQSGMILSPETWRTFLKPRLASFISEIKAINPALKVAYHSDGFIGPIIPELIEVGVDILNPIQPACMDPAQVKREFGDKLCFWGSIDEQHTLPFGTPEEVQQEVLTRLTTIGKGGGLIISPTHFIQLDTPMENFWAMVRAITETPYVSLN